MTVATPALVIVDPVGLLAVAALAADKCLFFAQQLEANAVISRDLYPYMADLARGAQALVDGMPDALQADLSVKVSRLENALDSRQQKAAA